MRKEQNQNNEEVAIMDSLMWILLHLRIRYYSLMLFPLLD